MALTDQGENIEAIARYIGQQVPPRTPAAVTVRDQWQAWWSNLSDYAKNFDQSAYDHARNWKLRFNEANARTPEELELVKHQATTGLTTEEIEGEADRRREDGSYVPAPSHGETLGHVVLVAGLALGVLLFLKVKG